MTGRMKRDGHVGDTDRLAKTCRLHRAGEIGAVAQRHDIQRFARRQNLVMARARMVGMAVRGDQCTLHRPAPGR